MPGPKKTRSASVASSASDNESLHANDEAERQLSAVQPVTIGTSNLPVASSGLSRTPSTPVLTITPTLNVVNAIKNRADRKAAAKEAAPDPTIYTRPETGEKVSTRDRIVKDVPAPATKKPTDDQFWTIKNEKPNVEFLKQHFALEGRLTTEQATWLVQRGTEMLRKENNLLELEGPITICGDIHGQYFDLLKLFEVGGSPVDVKYLFLGDYVDRGYFSIECVLYLWAMKIVYPDRIFMLRGNHECKHLTEYFTFKLECIHKYSEELYESVLESFCALPLAATVNKQFICVHGGISPDWGHVEDINEIDRFREPPTHGLMCDVLWSDPLEDYDRSKGEELFVHNDQRGCSYYYSYPAVCAFLERNNLLSLIRAHEVQDPGYRLYKARKSTNFASMITLFSAPNYLDTYKNKAAVLRYDTNTMNIRQFSWSPHPYWLPNFMDVFTWSLPFVGEKVTDMLLAIVSICSREELEEELAARKSKRKARIVIKMPDEPGESGIVNMEGFDSIGSIPELTVTSPESGTAEAIKESSILTKEKRQAMRNKLRAVGKLGGMFRVLREEAEALSELKNLMGSARLPAGSLALGAEGIRQAILTFEEARRADRDNERYPTPEPDRPASPQPTGTDKSLTGSLKRAPSLKSVQNLKREKLVNDDEQQLEAAIEYMDLDEEAKTSY